MRSAALISTTCGEARRAAIAFAPDLTRLGWLPAENPTAIHSVVWSTETVTEFIMLDDVQLDNRPQTRLRHQRPCCRPPFECIALLLQGGGALGAYQGGVYEALAEARIHPDWTAGISIGAINAALIAGNPPEERVDKLRRYFGARR
ncbi:MAG: patatin-like phospholipase family protein [Stellaceae bacterium]